VQLTPTLRSLSGGTLIGFRPIAPDDASRLVDAFDQLSPESRYRRFLRPIRTLSDTDIHTFTHVDFVDHVAWVAELLGKPRRPFAGVGRWIRSKSDPSVAEVGLTVVDAYQRQGLGKSLLRLLAASALMRGVRCFEGIVLVDNQPMRSLLRNFAARQVGFETGAIVYRLQVSHLVDDVGDIP
jgi:RimJ/RimL family protein N-acetyltransferase